MTAGTRASEAPEESPGSTGQDAGENPRRGDPRKVQQRADRLGAGCRKASGDALRTGACRHQGKGERVR